MSAIDQTMVMVTAEDADAYCRILTVLGMEEEGDAVAEISRLQAERDALQGQVAAMRDELSWFISEATSQDCYVISDKRLVHEEAVPRFRKAVTDTATIAAAHDARVRDEMVERCAALVPHHVTPTMREDLILAMRALKTAGTRSDDK